jgi:hypothetical protein
MTVPEAFQLALVVRAFTTASMPIRHGGRLTKNPAICSRPGLLQDSGFAALVGRDLEHVL